MNEWLNVHALIDDELDGQTRKAVREHMQTCAVCQAEWEAVREVKTVVVTKCVQPDCAEVWAQCTKRLSEIDRTRKVESYVGRYAWAACAGLFVVVLGAAAMNRFNGNDLRTDDVARISSSLAPISAPRSQALDDKRHWLQNNLDQAMPMKSNTLNVIGGAMGYFHGRKIARADLEDGQGLVDLFVVHTSNGVDGVEPLEAHGQFSGGRINDLNCITWTDHGNAYMLIGKRPIDGLVDVAATLYPKSQP